MSSVCFSIAKEQCQKFNKIGYFFSLSYIPMHGLLKRKVFKENQKQKQSNTFKYGWKRVSRRCGSYRMYLEGDSLHQTVMIVWECIWFSLVSNLHNMRHLCTLAMFHTQHTNSLLLLIHVLVQCDLAIIGDTCVNICSLNCLNLFLKYKIG